MTEFACNPTDYEQLPWQTDCDECTFYHVDPEPGLFTWVQAVAAHFCDEHQVMLVGA